MLAALTSQSAHGLWAKETTKVERGLDDEAADATASRRTADAGSGKRPLLRNGYEEKSAESMNLKEATFRESHVSGHGIATLERLVGFVAALSFMFLPPAAAESSIR
jgi:hypothetical protein